MGGRAGQDPHCRRRVKVEDKAILNSEAQTLRDWWLLRAADVLIADFRSGFSTIAALTTAHDQHLYMPNNGEFVWEGGAEEKQEGVCAKRGKRCHKPHRPAHQLRALRLRPSVLRTEINSPHPRLHPRSCIKEFEMQIPPVPSQ
jgi:hypothetical protein